MNWTDPAIQAAVIQTVGGIVAAIITAITAALIGKYFANRKKLQCKLVTAQQDIEFLLAVEALYCEQNIAEKGQSLKNKMRAEAKARNSNLKWSGEFTPGRANDSEILRKARIACAES